MLFLLRECSKQMRIEHKRYPPDPCIMTNYRSRRYCLLLSLNWFGEKVVLPVKGADISNGLAEFLSANHPAHDLTRARLGQARCKLKFVWHCQGTDCRTHVQLEFLCQLLACLILILENDKDFHMLTLHRVWLPDGGSLCDGGMANHARLNLHRT